MNRSVVFATAALVGVVAHERKAGAQQHELAYPGPAVEEDLTARNHDGFFLRASLGAGPSWLTEKARVGSQTIETFELSGATGAFELLFGGTPAPGLVLGGGVLGYFMVDPRVKVAGQTLRTEDTSVILSTLALFANYYPDPREGLYLQALLGYGMVDVTVDGRSQDTVDIEGAVLGAGIGYDFWIADQWSLGPAFRLTYARLGATEGIASVRESWVIPTLFFSATYH